MPNRLILYFELTFMQQIYSHVFHNTINNSVSCKVFGLCKMGIHLSRKSIDLHAPAIYFHTVGSAENIKFRRCILRGATVGLARGHVFPNFTKAKI